MPWTDTRGSAGGYLAPTSGFAVTPKPTALVAYDGYGDVDGEGGPDRSGQNLP